MIEDIYKLSPLQEGLYFHWLTNPYSQDYFVQLSFKIKGKLDVDILKESYQELVARHPLLRTFFSHEYGSTLLQIVKAGIESEYQIIEECNDIIAEEFKVSDRSKGFDLNRGSQMRLGVLKFDDETFELVWSHHHIIMDGWCLSILMRDFFSIYLHRLSGQQPVFAKLVPFSNYIKWLETRDENESIDYWRKKLAHIEENTVIPFQKNAHESSINKSEHVGYNFTKETSDKIRNYCKQNGLTENTFFQTLWAIHLSKFTQAKDIVFGSVVSGRPADLEGVEEMIGLFSNTVPVHVAVNTSLTVAALAKHTQESFIDSINYHHMQLADILSTTAFGNALFDHILVYENYPVQELIAGKEKNENSDINELSIVSSQAFDQIGYNFWVTFSSRKDFSIDFGFNSFIYNDVEVKYFLDRFVNLIDSLLVNPVNQIKELSNLDHKEYLNLIQLSQGRKVNLRGQTVLELFQNQVKINEEKIAVKYRDKEFTFNEIDELSSRLASNLLLKFKILKGDIIAVELPRDERLIICYLAVIKCGAVFLPIDSSLPAERREFIHRDSKSVCCLTTDLFNELIEVGPINKQQVKVKGNDVMYLLYTSGSTGMPKGCLLNHEGIVNRLEWMWKYLEGTQSDVILNKTNCAFDVSIWEIFLPICFGATLVFADGDIADPDNLVSHIEKYSVSILHFVPSMLNEFIDSIKLDYQNLNKLRSLKQIISSGEELKAEFVNKWYNISKIPIYNFYGPTEASIDVTFFKTRLGLNSIPIGRPINNMQVYILDPNDFPQPKGAIGEICLSGIGLAQGYLNRETLTAERFVPFSSNEEITIYRTGDLGRWLWDGNIEFLGRIDDQVKIRGYRIELAEIENALLASAEISSAVVIANDFGRGELELCAFVVSEREFDKNTLHMNLLNRIPAYMVPVNFIRVDSIPLTANGKADKKALSRIPINSSINVDLSIIAPESDTEVALTALWAEVLGIEKQKIGKYSDFFELGGHSLRTIRLMSTIFKKFNVQLGLKLLFDNSSLSGQALLIEKSTLDGSLILTVAPPQEAYEILPTQLKLWMLSQNNEANITYNVYGVYEFEKGLDQSIFDTIFKYLIKRHEVLRTSFFIDKEGKVQQKIIPVSDVYFNVELVDIDNKTNLEEGILDKIFLPFDLKKGPLLKAYLFRAPGAKLKLVFVIHHIICDDWSFRILENEFHQLMKSQIRNEQFSLPEVKIQFKDFSTWKLNALTQGKLLSQREYWANKLGGDLIRTQFPLDMPKSGHQTYEGRSLIGNFDQSVLRSLKNLATDQKTTLYVVVLSAIKAILFRYTSETDILVGSSSSSREREELYGTIGYFVNSLPLRTILNADDTFLSLLNKVKATVSEALENQDYDFEEIYDNLNNNGSVNSNALFNIMVVFQPKDADQKRPPIASNSTHSIDSKIQLHSGVRSKFDISFFIREMETSISINIIYNSKLYEDKTIKRLFESFNLLVTSIGKFNHCNLNKLPVISKEDLISITQFLPYATNSFPEYNSLSILDLFDDQVRNNGNAIAVSSNNRQLSYLELDIISSRLAKLLLNDYKLVPGALVGILLDRNIDYVTCMLAIMKTGAAYLPIDIEFPQERIRTIVKESQIKIVITQSEYLFSLDYFSGTLFAIDIQLDQENLVRDYELKRNITKNDCAYVVYTSGSTGKPKGVRVSHGAILDYLYGIRSSTNISEAKSFGLLSSFATDLGNTTLFTSLCSGGRLVIFSTEESMSGRAIKRHNLDCIKIVPTHWKLLALSEGIFAPNTTLIFGGESIGEDVLDLLRKNSISCIIYNHYGPTETTIGKLIYKINIQEKDKLLPLGRPFGNNEVYLLNGQGDFVPVGAIGEIYIGGVGLSLGYLHDAKLTKEKFVKARWDDSLILYKTGDYGRWLNDKNLFFEGRKDAQIKIRGNRVELSEITRRLEELEYIDQAILLPFTDLESQIELYAFLISKYEVQKEIILEYLSEYLPSYMIPKELIFVEKIPLLANGKLDVKSLKQLAVDLEIKTFKIESLTTCTEIELAKIWSKVLNISLDNIGKKEHFFNLGGHSLKVAQVVNEVNKKFNKNIEFYEIFETPVLEEQAKLILDSRSVKYIPIGKTSEKGMYRVSASQRRIWLVCQNPAAGSIYNIPKFYEFADLNIEKFKKAVNLVVKRHEILRTIFKEVQHEADVMQIILNMNDITIVVHEIDLRGNDDPYSQVLDKINIDAKTQFDLEEFPLFVLNLYRIADKNHILSFVIHHIISDAWSAQNVMKEFLLAYNAFLKDEEPNLSNIEIQYKDFSEWQHDQLDTGKLNNQKTFWLDLFDDLPEKTVLPHQLTFDALKTYHGSQENFSIDVKILNQFNKLLAKSDNSTFTGILALISILLRRYTNSDKIIFGIPIPGRTKEELHNSVGMFVNLLPIKIDFKPEDTFRDLVDQVQRYLSLAMQNQDYPYDSLIDELNSLNNACKSLFEIMVTYNDLKDTKSSNNTEILGFNTSSQLNREYGGNGTSKYDISFNFSDSDDGLILRIEYNSDLFNRTFILTFFDHFLGLFNSLLKNPQSLISNLEMLADQELKELLRIGSTDEYKFIESNVIELFHHNFLDKENLLAYASGKVKYTYSQIDKVSNKGAIYLENYFEGKKGNIIAVLLQNKDERSILSILSILKSGNTYLPIDPNVSDDRRNFILTNSNCKYIIDENSFEEMFSIVEEEIPLMKINSSDIAYILYTSGTTGTPKGVKITHQSLFKTIRGHLSMMSLEPGMRMTQFFPLTFDPSLLEIFIALCSGCQLFNVDENLRLEPENLVNFIKVNKIDISFLPPAILRVIAIESLKNLKILLTGGELIDKKYVEQFSKFGKYYNSYGLTETAIASTYFEYNALDELRYSVPIGKPLEGTYVYVVDNDLNLVPKGINGEIVIGGLNPSDGYLDIEPNEKPKFLKDPFRKDCHIFLTGDIGRWDNYDNLIITGRADNQVKINGYRVELSEIEYRLRNLSFVSDARALINIRDGAKQLVAALETDEELNLNDINAVLRAELPHFMVPKEYYIYKAFPVNKNGKIDFEQIKKLNAVRLIDTTSIIKLTGTQQILHENWCRVLKLHAISIDSSFFDIGGDSLLAVTCVGAINDKIHRRISVRDLYNCPTIKLLADLIEQEGGNISNSEVVDCEIILNELIGSNPWVHPFQGFEDKFDNVLLTGATGFVGIYLLQQILEKASNATIYCLVRAADISLAKARIIKNMSFYGLFKDEYLERIVPVLGDLEKEHFDIPKEQYINLAHKIDYIYNTAAEMDLISNFEKLKKVNVVGTLEIIKFSTYGKSKKIIHTSTLSIFSSNDKKSIDESTNIQDEKHYHSSGYASSKWMSEMLLFDFKEKGLPIQIHRLGLITGDRISGRMPSSQWFPRFLKSCYEMGEYPLGYEVPITPVDFVASSIYELSRLSNDSDGVFHISNEINLPIEKFFCELRQSKVLIPLEGMVWFNSQYQKSKSRPLDISPFLDARITKIDENDKIEMNFSSSNKKVSTEYTMKRLSSLGIYLPELEPYAKKYLANLINNI